MKDNRDSHFRVSMWKSGFRIGGCVLALTLGSIQLFILAFLVAEILGVIEEL